MNNAEEGEWVTGVPQSGEGDIPASMQPKAPPPTPPTAPPPPEPKR